MSADAERNISPAATRPAEGETSGSDSKTAETRTPLWARIALVAVAVLALCGAGVIAVNLSAIGTYNQATESLNRNLKLSKSDTVDLNKLAVQQQQTDEQFSDASQFNPLLLPQIRQSVESNTQISHSLTSSTKHKIRVAKREAEKNASDPASANGGKDGKGSLNDDQRAQVEELLSANQPASGSNNNGSNHAKRDQNTKPW